MKMKKTLVLFSSLLMLTGISYTSISANADNINTNQNINVNDHSILNGKRIAFLGSSITQGLYSGNVSFVDLMSKHDGIIPDKEAVSGTAMAGITNLNYFRRMQRKIPKNQHFDAFVTQLSTNDDKIFHFPIGDVSPSYNLNDFNTRTTTGAIEYIAKYVQDTWHCPLVFYTCLDKGDAKYGQLVQRLYQLQNKWHFKIIDLYNNKDLNNEMYKPFSYNMANNIHPTLKGYKLLTPYFEDELSNVLNGK
ncbi:SGNH/GDSL hydrolase family protein [Apilactobacillus micheneri]|uniref:SGNH/GDSL hydrolase family protein n=1 Tax=Apilactobacillus micheneri TaxID=1899430 RepID=UPI00112DAB4C|nr:SGNH/GDSL hydrolase family protein [Apilactobacillus micheneri]TPR42344.1 SGNH/GDSL hydrolase family protein [Apilactobacillus micheneri]TPR47063.1 SGNH/GDSL hydrolase family protein [Apilactobacillus micheneri]